MSLSVDFQITPPLCELRLRSSWGIPGCVVLVAVAPLRGGTLFRFLVVAAFGCWWTCGFFCGRVVPEARTGLVLPSFWWFLALGYGFVWGALGTFVFVCFLPVGTSSVCAPAFGCSGSVWCFLEGHSLPVVFRGLSPFLLGRCCVDSSACCGFFFCLDR